MNPEQLDLISADLDQIHRDGGEIASTFYETLFELDPGLRELFPDDMAAQRRKLISELQVLAELGLSIVAGHRHEFADRTVELGARHRSYGARADHYELVEISLLATLEQHVTGWDDDHRAAWQLLNHLVTEAMQVHTPTSHTGRQS